MKDSHQRSFVKAITWRVIATLTTMTIVWFITSDFKLSLGAGVLDVVIKLILYYIHERAWFKIKWGRPKVI